MKAECNPRWTTRPLAKRVWFRNNRNITQRLKREALRERGYFRDERGKGRVTISAYSNDRLLPMAIQAREEGLYSQKTGLRDIAHSLQCHIEKVFGITRKWLPDGWKNVGGELRFKRDRGL